MLQLPIEWPTELIEIVLSMLFSIKEMPNLLIDANDPKVFMYYVYKTQNIFFLKNMNKNYCIK